MGWKQEGQGRVYEAAYELGLKAQERGALFHYNPYSRHNQSYFGWAHGWLDAYEVNHSSFGGKSEFAPPSRPKVFMAEVTFDRSSYNKRYSYKCDIADLQVGDKAVVVAPDGPAIVTVRAIELGVVPRATKWIVSKVDLTSHLERINRQERAKEIKKELQRRALKVRVKSLLDALFDYDKEAYAMFEELKAIDPNSDPLSDGWGQ